MDFLVPPVPRQQSVQALNGMVREGRIKYREDVVDGLKNAPRAFIGLLRGENFGKLLVRVTQAYS